MLKNHLDQEKLISPLKRLRLHAGLSQSELARLLSVDGMTITDRAISAWERGDYQPHLPIAQVKALCKALGVTLDQMPDNLGPPIKPSASNSIASKISPSVKTL